MVPFDRSTQWSAFEENYSTDCLAPMMATKQKNKKFLRIRLTEHTFISCGGKFKLPGPVSKQCPVYVHIIFCNSYNSWLNFCTVMAWQNQQTFTQFHYYKVGIGNKLSNSLHGNKHNKTEQLQVYQGAKLTFLSTSQMTSECSNLTNHFGWWVKQIYQPLAFGWWLVLILCPEVYTMSNKHNLFH